MAHDALRKAIRATGQKQYRLADACKISETRFSKIVTGREQATPEEQQRIAKALKLRVGVLFGPEVPDVPV